MAAHQFSLRAIVLGVVLCFASTGLSAVLGIDLGTEYIKAALIKPGMLDIVLTKDSRRKETSAVAFKPPRGTLADDEYPERAYGSDAIALAARFPADVYPNLKTLLGLPTNEEIVQEYLARHPALQVEQSGSQGTVAFKSSAFGDSEDAWMVEELLAMELQSIQQNAEATAGSTIQNVVITVPPYFTIEEKRALEQTAGLVGLKVLSLMTDGVAVGLNYATSRTFPNINEGGNAEQHMVFDMGAGSSSATIMKFQGRSVKDVGKFNKTIQEIQAVGTSWDRTLGGDALNYIILDDMISKFVDTSAAKKAGVTAEGVRAHGRTVAKLLKEAERLRHILSANVDTQGFFESLYEDVDFRYKVTRADFEAMAEAHAERVGRVLQNALDTAELDISQVDSIILHGGASRTPFVQKQLEKIAGSDKIRANVNSDEAAVFGAGFRAAGMSPSFRVKEIRVSDVAGYPAGMKWTSPQGKPQQQRLWTARSLLGAAPKEVTFANHEDFSVNFYQQALSSDGPADKDIAAMTTQNLTASVAQLVEKNGCLDSDIHFKVQLRLTSESGEVDVVKAFVECEAEFEEKEGIIDGVKNLFGFGKKDQESSADGEEATESSVDADTVTASDATATAKPSEAAAEDAPKKKTLVTVPVKHTVEKLGEPQLSKAGESKAKQRIKSFDVSDKARKLREDTLNQLEAFTYKIRDLLEEDSFVGASTSEERSKLEKTAGEAGEWLYEGGVDAPRAQLKSRLDALKELVSPIQKRVDEGEKRPETVKTLEEAIKSAGEMIETIKSNIAEADRKSSSYSSKYSTTGTQAEESTVTEAPESDAEFDGLEDDDATTTSTTTAPETPPTALYSAEDLKTMEDIAEETKVWLEAKVSEQEALAAAADPVLLVSEVESRTKKLEQAARSIALKAKRASDANGKGKKESSSSSKKSSKSKKTATETASGKPTPDFQDNENFIKLGEDGKMPTEEELEELIRKLTKEKDAGTEHDEL